MRVTNRKARFNYHILESLEAGIVLSGFEVKSIRAGKVDLSESFARIFNDEVVLKNAYIYPFQVITQGYDPRHDRKLLLHRNQIEQLKGKLAKAGMALIPLSIYEKSNFFKVELGIVASKKKFDKRRVIKEKDQQRQLEQDLRGIKDSELRRE